MKYIGWGTFHNVTITFRSVTDYFVQCQWFPSCWLSPVETQNIWQESSPWPGQKHRTIKIYINILSLYPRYQTSPNVHSEWLTYLHCTSRKGPCPIPSIVWPESLPNAILSWGIASLLRTSAPLWVCRRKKCCPWTCNCTPPLHWTVAIHHTTAFNLSLPSSPSPSY